jgi:hypothetical protein
MSSGTRSRSSLDRLGSCRCVGKRDQRRGSTGTTARPCSRGNGGTRAWYVGQSCFGTQVMEVDTRFVVDGKQQRALVLRDGHTVFRRSSP